MAAVPFVRFLLFSLLLSALVLGAWFAAGFGLERTYGALGQQRYASYVMWGIGVLGLIALFLVARHARSRLYEECGKR